MKKSKNSLDANQASVCKQLAKFLTACFAVYAVALVLFSSSAAITGGCTDGVDARSVTIDSIDTTTDSSQVGTQRYILTIRYVSAKDGSELIPSKRLVFSANKSYPITFASPRSYEPLRPSAGKAYSIT